MALAPMSGVTDEAFRLMLLKLGRPDVFWTEFVSAEGLFSKGRDYCLGVLKRSDQEQPIVAQLFGGEPGQFEEASALIAELGFDGVDINMGCPDANIEKKGGGAALIKNPVLAKKIIRAAKKGAGKIPVSVKTRIGYEKNQIAEWMPALLEENISALTVHFRTKKEAYSGQAHWEAAEEIIKLRDKIAPETLILGNGDVKSLEHAKELVERTGVDGIAVGRAALANPWFFAGYFPAVSERLNAIIEHTDIFSAQGGPASGWESMKKYFHAYAKGFDGARELRERLMKTKTAQEAKKEAEAFLALVLTQG